MLFLAVTLGFFVENQREHYIEHQREKQFIRSLFRDIKRDTSNLVSIIEARTVRERSLDSLTHMMNTANPQDLIREIYNNAIFASRTFQYRFVPNDGTIQQLKNSGSFRLIRNRVVADSISQYDISVRNFLGQYAVEENQIEHYRTASAKIFDALVFDEMIDENSFVTREPQRELSMQPYDKRELYEWNFRIYGLKGINKANRRQLRSLLEQAKTLLELLKKEYDIE
jgi:hypothetical protein